MLIIFGGYSYYLLALGFVFLLLSGLSFAYLIGLNGYREWFLLPLLTLQLLIIVLLIGVALVAWMIALLSFTDCIYVQSPIGESISKCKGANCMLFR